LVGQVLWVTTKQLISSAIITAIILLIWFKFKNYSNHTLFYLLFAVAVTVSVQLVGVYLVFASLIIPALATRNYKKRRLIVGYLLSAIAYLIGLACSAWFDLPAGAVIVWVLALLGMTTYTAKSPNKTKA
jgi:zinc/manganese transport system permease protein